MRSVILSLLQILISYGGFHLCFSVDHFSITTQIVTGFLLVISVIFNTGKHV